jgi:hypothetical protein
MAVFWDMVGKAVVWVVAGILVVHPQARRAKMIVIKKIMAIFIV